MSIKSLVISRFYLSTYLSIYIYLFNLHLSLPLSLFVEDIGSYIYIFPAWFVDCIPLMSFNMFSLPWWLVIDAWWNLGSISGKNTL